MTHAVTWPRQHRCFALDPGTARQLANAIGTAGQPAAAVVLDTGNPACQHAATWLRLAGLRVGLVQQVAQGASAHASRGRVTAVAIDPSPAVCRQHVLSWDKAQELPPALQPITQPAALHLQLLGPGSAVAIALLLPAVQKVREAAARMPPDACSPALRWLLGLCTPLNTGALA